MNLKAEREPSMRTQTDKNSVKTVIALIVCFCASLALTVGCKGGKVISHWSEKPVSVDGVAADWAGMEPAYEKEGLYSITVCNDRKQLNILLQFTDPTWVRSIRTDGLTFFIDALGGKSKAISMKYVGGPALEDLKKLGALAQRDSLDTRRLELEERFPELQRDGFTMVDKNLDMERALPIDGSRGPAAGFKMNGDTFVYEFSLPFEQPDKFSYGIGAAPPQTISVGLEWGKPSKKELDRIKRDPSQRLPDGVGQLPGGRDRQAGRKANAALFQKQEVWFSIALATGSGSAKGN